MCHYKMYITLLLTCWSLMHVTDALPVSASQLGSKLSPGKSCKDILANGEKVSGNYYIRLGGKTLLVYCDQTTAGGGWTLVYSFAFSEDTGFNKKTINCEPKPDWGTPGKTKISTTTPKSETDYNAMDFKLWKKLGTEFILKSNVNNWYVCSDGTGSLVFWKTGSIHCKLLKNVAGKCENVVPNKFDTSFYDAGPNFYETKLKSVFPLSIYFLKTDKSGVPSINPCGTYHENAAMFDIPNPHGNIYVR